MTTFSASLTNLTAFLPQSRDCSYYVNRRILAPAELWLQKHANLRVHAFAHSHSLWHQPKLASVTCAWSWRLCGIKPVIHVLQDRTSGPWDRCLFNHDSFNPLNTELNPICHLLALLEAHHILHVSRIRVNMRRDQKISLHGV